MMQVRSFDDRAAVEAANRAGVEVRELDGVSELAEAELLVQRVWGGGEDKLPLSLLKALAHSGNYVAGAWLGPELAGVSVAWAGGSGGGRTLHSHITGVLPALQSRGAGLALKLHQAVWAKARGMSTITWTFDPLIRANAWFNLVKLGARAVSYHPDFYGQLEDGINAGEPSDRCLIVWSLEPAPAVGSAGFGEATVVLSEGAGAEPVRRRIPEAPGPVLCQVPRDVVGMRKESPVLARQWRLAVRATMGEAMAAGYVATSFSPDGFYLLERKPE